MSVQPCVVCERWSPDYCDACAVKGIIRWLCATPACRVTHNQEFGHPQTGMIEVAVLRCQQGCRFDSLSINGTTIAGGCGGPYSVLMTFKVSRDALDAALASSPPEPTP